MDQVTKRRTSIVEFVNSSKEVSFAQLKQAFPHVSDMTLRTDLKALDDAKQIICVHGGAKSVDTIIRKGDHSTPELVPNRKKLQVLAQKAAKLIHPHTTIFLDSGEKTVEMARVMPDIPVEIYTVSLTCAIELARLKEAIIFNDRRRTQHWNARPFRTPYIGNPGRYQF